jgi:hypothetical protein
MKMLDNTPQSGQFRDRRARYRSKEMINPMAVINCHSGPLYQLKVRDLSYEGAGIVVRADSNLLKMIDIGQELKVRVVLPRDYKGPSGHYRSRVEHITEIEEGIYQGLFVMGISFLPALV